MSSFPLPAAVANRMEKVQRDLLWGGWQMGLSSIFLNGIWSITPFRREVWDYAVVSIVRK